jgi:hypothetical protein
MKRTRIFLGLTTCCLAVAGVVAAKAAHFGTIQAYYFTQPNDKGACIVTAVTTPCNQAASEVTCLTTSGLNSPANRYFTQSLGVAGCVSPLHYTTN